MIARLALVALLSGCAAWGPSEAECRGADWARRGYDDGYFGHPPQDLRLVAVCAQFGVRVPQDEYLAAWARGHDEWDRTRGSYGQD